MAKSRGGIATWLIDWRWRGSRKAFAISVAGGLVHSLLYVLAMPLISLWGFALLAMLPIMLASLLASRELRASHTCASERSIRLRWVLLGMLLGCLPRELVQHHWTWPVTALGTVPFILIQALWTGLFAALVAWLLGRAFPHGRAALTIPLIAICWVGVEYFRARVFMGGYAWGFVVHPLIDWPAAASIASIGGVWLVSLLVALASASLAWIVTTAIGREPDHKSTLPFALAGLVLPLAVIASGSLLAPAPREGETVPIAIVQTNVPQSNKVMWTVAQEVEDFQRFVQLTLAAAEPRDRAFTDQSAASPNPAAAPPPAFIVWPETMMPGISIAPQVVAELDAKEITLGSEQDLPGMPGVRRIPASAFADTLLALQTRLAIPLIIGEEARTNFKATVHTDGGVDFSHDQRFNSVFIVDAGKVSPTRYDKIELTPFGESIPFFWRWPAFVQAVTDFAAAGMALDLSRGTDFTTLEVPRAGATPLRIATPICFEVTVPELHRNLAFASRDGTAERRADLFVNLTNDGWFTSNNQTRVQHLQIARWRCAETGTPMVRAANTGISCIIDARGVVTRAGVEPVSPQGQLGPPSAQRWLTDGVIRGTVTLPAPASITPYARVSLLLGDVFGWLPCVLAGLLVVFGLVSSRKHTKPAPTIGAKSAT